MPQVRLTHLLLVGRYFGRHVPWTATVGAILALNSLTLSAPTAVRARDIELHYRLTGASSAAQIELWYTRDRGISWQSYGVDPDGQSPFLFTAPAEGLYGFTLIVHDGTRVSGPPPQYQKQPQRWVFVDYTPPLAQWSTVEPGDDFAHKRTVQLRWVAHDDHLTNRPIMISYQSSVDQQWQTIDSSMSNVGRYDWVVPEQVTGQVTLRLAVHDQGGHVVERFFGPIPVTTWAAAVNTKNTKSGAVADASDVDLDQSATAPASELSNAEPQNVPKQHRPKIDLRARREAELLYKQGSWHLLRGEYALAIERMSEALEQDPGMLDAMNDLAGIYCLQEDYDKAIQLYHKILQRDGNYKAALRGSVLAYVAKRQYAKSKDILERLLAANEADAEALLDLGDVLFMMGDRSGAWQHWQRATSVDASAEAIIHKARRRLEQYRPATSTGIPAVAAGQR